MDRYILEDEEIEKSKKEFVVVKKVLTSRWLRQYRALVANASSGAVLRSDL